MSKREVWEQLCEEFREWLLKDAEAHGYSERGLPYESNRALCWIQLEAPEVLKRIEATAEQTAFAAETAAVSPLRQVELAQARELERINAFIREMAKKCGYRPLNADQLSPEEDLAQSIAMLDRNLTQEIAEHQRHHDAEAAAGRASGVEWVPVTERLPEAGTRVLVYGPDRSMGSYYLMKNRPEHWYPGGWHVSWTTHWRPLPPPPEKPTEGGGKP